MKESGFLVAVMFFLSIGLSAAFGYLQDGKIGESPLRVKKEVKLAQAKESSMTKEKEKYEKKIQGELNGFKKKRKQLEGKAKNLKDKAEGKVKEQMGELRGKIRMAEGKLKSLKSASGKAWEKAKSEADSAMASVKETYDKIAGYFKK